MFEHSYSITLICTFAQTYLQTTSEDRHTSIASLSSTSSSYSFESDFEAQNTLMALIKQPPFHTDDLKIFRYLCITVSPELARPSTASSLRGSLSGTLSRPSSAAALSSTLTSISQEHMSPRCVIHFLLMYLETSLFSFLFPFLSTACMFSLS